MATMDAQRQAQLPPPKPRSSSSNVSYETFAPRSSAQTSRLSRIAELTAGPTARRPATQAPRAKGKQGAANAVKIEKDFLARAVSAPKDAEQSFLTGMGGSEVDAVMRKALQTTDHTTALLKHSTSLRLALRASMNIAEDISNRHADLIRHSSELSAAADRLQEEEAMLTRHAKEIGMPLKHYDSVDQLGVHVGVLFKGNAVVRGLAKVKVDNEDFVEILDKINDAVTFFERECGGKAALEEYKKQSKRSKSTEVSGNLEYFRRSLALQEAALFLVREAVVDRLNTTTEQITSALNLNKAPIAADRLEASLVYTRFHGISSRSNRLLGLVKKRLHNGEAYHELMQLCRHTYCTCRESLLKNTVRTHMENLKSQHGLVGMTRLASVFLIRLCTLETSLYLDFFGDRKVDDAKDATAKKDGESKEKDTKSLGSQVMKDDGSYYDSEFQTYLSSLCTALHRTVRRGLVTVVDLDTLCQIVSVLREERALASSSPTTTAAARAVSTVIEDAQERLIFCATSSLSKEVTRFKASTSDLNYPDKLIKKKKEDASGDDADDKADGATDAFDDAIQRQMQVYESWYPPIRSVLKILSKLFRVVEARVFEDIALQSVQSCTRCLKDAGSYIEKRKGIMHSDLFLVKHLLILREQLSPFDVKLRSVERQLDFSDAGKAVSRFLANRNRRLFSMSTENALVTLLREGVSVQEESVDSKRDLEDALRSACNAFIEHTSKMLVNEVVTLVESCHKVDSDTLKTQSFFNGKKVEDQMKKNATELEDRLADVTTQMGLYLDNPATQSILVKPIARRIGKTMEEVRKYIIDVEDGTNGWDENIRGQIFLTVDEIDKAVKKASKAAK